MFLAQILCALFEILTGFTCQMGVVVNSVVAGQPGDDYLSYLGYWNYFLLISALRQLG